MARALQPAGELVLDAAGVSRGDRVIDVGTGTGNAALLAAARGARVVGVDFEPALLTEARRRASDASADIEWVEGDAEALPIASSQADAVVSVFGAMYAANHATAARELVRVLAPSGRLALAAWPPESFMSAMGRVIANYLPPTPPASAPPSSWGNPKALQALLKDAGAKLTATSVERLTLSFDDAHAAADFLIQTAGHIVSHREQLTASGRWRQMREDLAALVDQHAERFADKILLGLDYLVAAAGRV